MGLEGLREETHIEFVPAPTEREGEFGRLLSDVPRPGIEDVHVLGNDLLSLSLSAHSGLSSGCGGIATRAQVLVLRIQFVLELYQVFSDYFE